MASNVTRTTRRDNIQFGANGYLSLGDNKIGVSSGDLTLDVAGDIKLDANGNTIDFLDGSQRAVTWEMTTGVATRLRMYEDGGDTELDFFNIDVATNGETNIATVDQAGTVGHITIAPDGDLVLDPASQKVIINATDKLYLDGGGDTYITETIADGLDIVIGGELLLRMFEGGGGANNFFTTGGVLVQQQDLRLTAAKKLYFDSGSDTYIQENVADNLKFTVGGDAVISIKEDGNAGNLLNIGTSGAGFQQHEPTYNASDTNVYFNRNGNKAFFTFGAGSVTDLNLSFPNVSCNCSLVIKQDGTGSRTVTNWKTFDQAQFNESTVKWPGGSAPTLSTGANAVDIISFYWDNDNHTAYGVASLNFS